jgi:hypothetical protein
MVRNYYKISDLDFIIPFKDYQEKLAYARELYKKNRKKIIKEVYQRKLKNKKWLEDYKKTLKCSLCGENHPGAIDFHHKQKKEFSIPWIVHNGYSIENIKKELEKCEVLCANCHRKLHYKNVSCKVKGS